MGGNEDLDWMEVWIRTADGCWPKMRTDMADNWIDD
jgi:hypothetical protein